MTDRKNRDMFGPEAFPDAWEMRDPGMRRLSATETKEEEFARLQQEAWRRWWREIDRMDEGDINAH